MSVVDQIKDRVDAVEIIGESVKLRKSGKNYTGFCPFHPNKRTPAFAVFPDTGTWRCFGACNEGGDVFSFLMKKEGWDFPETLRYLAERAGVELEPRSPQQEEQQEELERLREALEAAVTYFRHNLLQTQSGEPVLDYLHSRGLQDETLELFELGYAPDSWEGLYSHLTERGFEEDDLVEAGLLTERESGGFYDRFRHRIMFPIRDMRGRMAGFGARAVDPEGIPKYLNSPQTPLFDKGRILYGLDKARREIRKLDQAVIVEGYMDVIGLAQAGFENAVSPMGTALTESHLRLLKRYSRRMIMAMDADAAGVQATLRGLEVARESLDREADPVFNARGLVRHEGRLDADLRIVTLPDDVDPDELVLEDPGAWEQLIAKAQTIVDYVLDVLASEHDLDDPKSKALIARQVLPLIEDVADPVERETYRQRLARRLQVDERALFNWRSAAGRRREGSGPDAGEVVEVRTRVQSSVMEHFCLAMILKDPELLYHVDRAFQGMDLDRPTERDFATTENRMIYKCIRDSLAQDQEEPALFCLEHIDDSLDDVVQQLLEDYDEVALQTPKVLEELNANFFRLRKRRLETELNHLRFNLEDLQGDEEGGTEEKRQMMWQVTREVQGLTTQKQRLDQALKGGWSNSSIAIAGE
ncbi:MAG: DNA primase [Anaerolineales bacterium]|jgi:DNA primase